MAEDELLSLAVDLGKGTARVATEARTVLEASAVNLARTAQTLAPHKTGRLAKNIGYDFNGLTAEVGPTLIYGSSVEEGTSKMAPRPYLAPALEREGPLFEDALGKLTDGLL